MLPDLTGMTVLIVGNAPGMSRDVVDEIEADYVIAINRGVVHAPYADAMVSIDGNWPPAADTFAGLRLVGVPLDHGDAEFAYMPYEVVTLEPGNTVHLRNNTLAAIRLAGKAGARHFILVGFDPAAYEELHNFRGFVEGLAALDAELAEIGVTIEYGS